ncbi:MULTISPECIES: Zn-ribbon domain-containing OB-fold protein [Microbacterium]|uniref:ChsH2 C-terminal OB-fold domain-containing protein n=1 Tax=Microbacterium wangchenii TaxID=2541726 RepID=A0ABX5SPC2_9MICO|nr:MULTISPECIES: OB-fold domain-containing protein [Microbacterium]MCK6066658.1 OB-fold domain-containing protein [Microbacterium sp. EYE_512]QBR87989.1 hypothetical protein E4K62_04325 [Microbacterium wangchenii]TXK18221.1 hypothetical protein FVP99_06475 [Microbacterium wangchenii]
MTSPIARFPVERDEASARFFDATRDGRFLLRRAGDGTYFGPGVRSDPRDPAAPLVWSEASGRGKLVAWIVGRARPDDSGSQAVVSLGGLIALDEGPWILAPLECDDLTELRAGTRVAATYPMPTRGEVLPVFITT